MKITFLLIVLCCSASLLCQQFDSSYQYSNIFSDNQESEHNNDIISVYGDFGDYPFIAPEHSNSQNEYFANSVNIFQSIESVVKSFPFNVKERSFGIVSGNLVYNNIVKSGMVVKVIVLLTSQVFSIIKI
jgi:hypothetical protein